MFVAGFIQVSSIDVGDLSWAVSDVGALGTMFSNGWEFDFGVATPWGEWLLLVPLPFIA